MIPPSITNRTKAGLALIYLAGIGWIAELIVPFLHVDNKVGILIGNFILAEVAFIAGAALIGKTAYQNIKTKLAGFISRKQP